MNHLARLRLHLFLQTGGGLAIAHIQSSAGNEVILSVQVRRIADNSTNLRSFVDVDVVRPFDVDIEFRQSLQLFDSFTHHQRYQILHLANVIATLHNALEGEHETSLR